MCTASKKVAAGSKYSTLKMYGTKVCPDIFCTHVSIPKLYFVIEGERKIGGAR